MSEKYLQFIRKLKHDNQIVFFKVHIVGVSEWKKTWKKNMKSFFIVQQLLGLNQWIRYMWGQIKYFLGRLLLKGIIPESYWQNLPQEKFFERRYEPLDFDTTWHLYFDK